MTRLTTRVGKGTEIFQNIYIRSMFNKCCKLANGSITYMLQLIFIDPLPATTVFSLTRILCFAPGHRRQTYICHRSSAFAAFVGTINTIYAKYPGKFYSSIAKATDRKREGNRLGESLPAHPFAISRTSCTYTTSCPPPPRPYTRRSPRIKISLVFSKISFISAVVTPVPSGSCSHPWSSRNTTLICVQSPGAAPATSKTRFQDISSPLWDRMSTAPLVDRMSPIAAEYASLCSTLTGKEVEISTI